MSTGFRNFDEEAFSRRRQCWIEVSSRSDTRRPPLRHGSWRVFSIRDDEAEIMLGSLDQAPGELAPEYELWIGRREMWMQALPWTTQFEYDRTPDAEPIADEPLPNVPQQSDP